MPKNMETKYVWLDIATGPLGQRDNDKILLDVIRDLWRRIEELEFAFNHRTTAFAGHAISVDGEKEGDKGHE